MYYKSIKDILEAYKKITGDYEPRYNHDKFQEKRKSADHQLFHELLEYCEKMEERINFLEQEIKRIDEKASGYYASLNPR